jgi:phenylacetaldehyde dehydrogenase
MAALAQDVLARYPLNTATRAFLDRVGPMFIDGQWVKAKSGRTTDVFDPATARVIAQVADADRATV